MNISEKRRRTLPVIGLLLLAPFFAEYLVGSISVRHLAELPFLIPLYGAAALLIRETGRRTGRGWPTMLALGAAFGVFQAGIVDASLFNPHYSVLDLDSLDGAGGPAGRAVFGLAFVMNHMMLSIGAPIVLIEALAPDGDAAPWLGRVGMAITAVCYLGGSLLIGWDNFSLEHFYPSGPQLASAAVAVIVLIAVAFARPPVRFPAPAHRLARTPPPLRVALVTGALTGFSFFVPANWPGFVLGLVLIGVLGTLIARWSRATDWNGRHRRAVAAGVLFTAAWGAFVVGAFTGQTDLLTRLGNVAFALFTAALVGWTEAVSRRQRSPGPPIRRSADPDGKTG